MTYYKKHFFVGLFIGFANVLCGQNLVPNPDFEAYFTLPKSTSEFFRLKDWFNPADTTAPSPRGTPDFYHTEAGIDARMPTPSWAKGLIINPLSGKSIAGLIGASKNNIREYICIKLAAPLQKNQQYAISFSYCNGGKTTVGALACKLGVGFSMQRPYQNQAKPMFVDSYVQTDNIIFSQEWKKITFQYTATDAFEYLSIGNFEPNNTSIKKVFDQFILNEWAYYFIDFVEIPFVSPPKDDIVITEEEEKLLEKASYVQFKSNESVLLPASYAILDEVVVLLKNYPTGKLSLEGHTDNVGGIEQNLALSQARAEAVKAYFVSKGIALKRIEAKGFGLAKPKVTNDTDEHRSQNRRVEMKFVSE